eukprot:8596950-Pyramimonas_sp.AAC.1
MHRPRGPDLPAPTTPTHCRCIDPPRQPSRASSGLRRRRARIARRRANPGRARQVSHGLPRL